MTISSWRSHIVGVLMIDAVMAVGLLYSMILLTMNELNYSLISNILIQLSNLLNPYIASPLNSSCI